MRGMLVFPVKLALAPAFWLLMALMVVVEVASEPGRTPEVNRRELKDKMREYWHEDERA